MVQMSFISDWGGKFVVPIPEVQVNGEFNYIKSLVLRQAAGRGRRGDMKLTETKLKGAFIIDIEQREDQRGFFCS